MRRRTPKPCCPTCGRAIPQPKPTPTSLRLERLFREAFVTYAFAAREWRAVDGVWTTPRKRHGLEMQPATMTTGTTNAPDVGAWEQAELVTCAPRYQGVHPTGDRPMEPREARTGCSDEAPCALHRGRVAA